MRQLIFIFALLNCGRVHAGCTYSILPTHETVVVLKSWRATHVASGPLEGCILKVRLPNSSEIFAYTQFDYICKLDIDQPTEIARGDFCCDMGYMGDFVCGIKTVDENTGVPQVTNVLKPYKPDRRAISDLLNSLDTMKIGAGKISEILTEYAKIPKLKEELKKVAPRLKEMLEQADSEDRKSAISEILKRIGQLPDDARNMKLQLQRVLQPQEASAVRSWKYSPTSDTWSEFKRAGAAPIYQLQGSNVTWDAVPFTSKLFLWGSVMKLLKPKESAYTLAAFGSLLDLKSGTWQSLSPLGAPSARLRFFALKDDESGILWGGETGTFNDGGQPTYATDGAVFDSQTRKWTAIPSLKSAAPLGMPSALWADDKLWVVGFYSGLRGGIYNPKTKVWEDIPLLTAEKAPDTNHVLLWTGKELLVWGQRRAGAHCTLSGALYDAKKKSWRNTAAAPAPLTCDDLITTTLNERLLAWNGKAGALYSPSDDQWKTMSLKDAPPSKKGEIALAANGKFWVWEGASGQGALYDPEKDAWEKLSDKNAPSPRFNARATVVMDQIFIFGGRAKESDTVSLNTGALYDLKKKEWRAVTKKGAPVFRNLVSTPKLFTTGTDVVLIDAGSSW